MNLDFHRLKEAVHREILDRLSQTNLPAEAPDFSWLTYGLWHLEGSDGTNAGPACKRLERWALAEEGERRERYLAPLCLSYCLSQDEKAKQVIGKKIRQLLARLLGVRSSTKFDVLNDPSQVLAVAMAKGALDTEMVEQTVKRVSSAIGGRTIRKALFSAAITKLTGSPVPNEVLSTPTGDLEDVIAVLWLARRYNIADVVGLWEKVSQTMLPILGNGTFRDLGVSYPSVALLAEVLQLETTSPSPQILFNLFPFEPEIRKIAGSHFHEGRFTTAVFQATMKLNEFIQARSGSQKSEGDLVQYTMQPRGSKPPIIQFNEFWTEISGKNEQSGLALIAKGIFTGFRNPKGHKPEDHPLGRVDAYEALAQLVVIDYIWKRVSRARIRPVR